MPVSGRTLPHGRHTAQDPGEAFRKTGLIAALGNKGLFGDYLDQLLFEGHGVEHVLGSAVQVASDYATITWDQAQQRFENKAGAEVVPGDYQRIMVMGMDTLTDNIVIDNITGLEIFHVGNTPGQTGDNPKFQLGDSGGGVPYKIKLGPNTRDCKLDLLTDKPFRELSHTLSLDQKRYVANQGLNNYIKVNGVEIYNPSHTGEIIQLDSLPANPYLARMDGVKNHWMADASNVNLAWFRDLNIFLNGLRFDGTVFQETQSRFTNAAIIAATPWLFQVNQVYRFLTDLAGTPFDTRINERLSPTVAIELAASFTISSDTVTFLTPFFEGNAKNYMRIIASVLPSGLTDTVLLVDINTATHTAKMIDALTGAPVLATGTVGFEVVFISNSGAAAGSYDEDALQNITGTLDMRSAAGNPIFKDIGASSGALNFVIDGGTDTDPALSSTGVAVQDDRLDFNASDSLDAKIHDQTQPQSTAVRFYYRP